MLLIPVLDIQSGVVVHATGGDRASYAPIETPLAPGRCDPVGVALGYRTLHPFPILYVADLDGIAGHEVNVAAIEALAEALPDVALWIDDGRTTTAAHSAGSVSRLHYVLGSETLVSIAGLNAQNRAQPAAGILSLDFKGDQFLGPSPLLAQPELWPQTVIVMTLSRVGSGAGPDLARLTDIVALAQGRRVFAAGGVRHAGDLEALAGIGISGVLVATALHSGAIKAGDLERVAGL